MLQFFIDNEEIVCEPNIEIQEEFMNVSHLELYKVYPKSWKGTNKLLTDYYYPSDYSKCKILKDGELIFCGITKNSDEMEINPFKPHYCNLQILDFSTFLSEGDTLNFVIANKTVEEAIEQVIEVISSYGFVKGKILIPKEKNTNIVAYSTLEKAPYDIFQYLASISETRWGTRTIDENTVAIDFFTPELLENKGILKSEQNYFKENKITSFTYGYSTSNYRNKQITTSDEVYASINQTQTIISNGYDKTFLLEQKIGKIISIKVNDSLKTFVTNEEKEKGINADFYYKASDFQITSNVVLEQGTTIVIEYTPIVRGREISINSSEIERVKKNTGRNGTITRYENRNDIADAKELRAISKTYIKYQGKSELTLNINSTKDFLELGGKYYFEAPIKELVGEYLVKTKNTRIFYNTDMLHVKYEYQLTNTFDLENEINFFDNQRAKNSGNISQGEHIARDIDIENTTNIIFSNLRIEEIENISNNALEMSLDGTLIC